MSFAFLAIRASAICIALFSEVSNSFCASELASSFPGG